jgi:quercetin dioxygenase-like cupin family protein
VRVTSVGLTPEGGSQFGEVDIDLVDQGEIGRLSAALPVTGVVFRENDPGYDFDWHNAPQRQLIVLLDGEIEVEVTSGEKRRFSGGEVLLVEDTTGSGHRTRSIGDRVRRSLFLPLA